MDSRTEMKMCKLRNHLDMLGYTDHLGAESLPLVEKLFSDLVHTTERLRQAKRLAGKSEKEIQNCDVLSDPYRKDNAQVAQENHQLHLELVRVKEEKDHETREMKMCITKLEDELSFLESLNNQYAHQVRCLEKDSKEKAKRLRHLQKKNCSAAVHAREEKKLSVPSFPPSPHSQSDDAYGADLWQAEGRILEVHYEVRKLKEELGNAQGQVQLLNNHIEDMQVTNKQLKRKLEGLQQKSSTKVADLASKNRELCGELMHILHLARQMEIDKKQKLKTADMKFQDMNEVIKDLKGQLQKSVVDQTYAPADGQEQEKRTADHQNGINSEASEWEFIKSHLGDQLVELREQNEKLEGMVDFLEAEKSRLQDKVEKMMSVERVLVLELEGMRTRYGICGWQRSPSRLDAFVKSLEEERDHYRQEAEHYKIVRVPSSPSHSHSPGKQRSPKYQVIKPQHDYESSNQSAEILNLKVTLRLVEQKLQQVTAEKHSLMEELKHLQQTHHSSNTPPDNLTLAEKLRMAGKKMEFEQLQPHQPSNTSTKISNQKEELPGNIQGVTEEKEAEMEEYKQQQQHEQHTTNTSSEILNLNEELRKTEGKIQLVTAEKDLLMGEMQQMQLHCEQRTSEIVTLKEELRLAGENIQQVTAEKDSLMEEFQQKQLQCEAHTSEIVNLKEELKLAEDKIQQTMNEKDAQKKTFKKMQWQHAHKTSNTFDEIMDLNQQLHQAEEKTRQATTEKESLMEKLKQMEQQHQQDILSTSAEILKLKEELKLSEGKTEQVAAEKDSLMEEFQQKQLQCEAHTSEIVNLKEELKLAEDKIQQTMNEKDAQKKTFKKMQWQHAHKTSNTFDEIMDLNQQLHQAEEKTRQATTEKESLMEKLKQMEQQHQQDILSTSAEILKLKEELKLSEGKTEQVAAEKEALMEKLKQNQRQHKEHNSNTAAEILKLRKKLNLAEDKVQQVASEKDTQMDDLKQMQLEHEEQKSAEISNLEEELKLAEKKILQVTDEKETLIEETEQIQMEQEQSKLNASEEMFNLRQELKQAAQKIQQVTAEKDSLMEKLKHPQHKQDASTTSEEISKLKEVLRQAEDTIQQVMSEKEAQMKDFKKLQMQNESHKSTTLAEILNLKATLRLAEEKVQQVTAEKDSLMQELKKMQQQKEQEISNTSSEILKLKKKVNLAEEKVQEVASEKDTQMEELKQIQLELEEQRSAEIAGLEVELKLAERKIQQVTDEKETLMEEAEQVQVEQEQSKLNTSDKILNLIEQLSLAKEKIRQMTAEKNSLMDELKQKQLQNARHNSTTSAEISNLSEKLRMAEERIQHLTSENEKVKQPQRADQNSTTSAKVLTLKEKLRVAEEQTQQATAEKDSLMEELPVGLPSALSGVCGKEQRIPDLQHVIKRLEQENLELRSQFSALKDSKQDVEQQMDVEGPALVQDAEEVAAQQRRTAAAGLGLQQEIRHSFLDLQEMLSVRTHELHAAHGQMEKLEDIIGALRQQAYLYKQEAEVLQISFSALCMKKDALQEEVAQKTKRLVVLQQELALKLQGELKGCERELTTQRTLEVYQEALARLKRDNDLIIREYKRLQDDVTAVTMEKQAAHVEMEGALHERNELQHRVYSYLNTVSKFENLLKTKEQENLGLLERFHTAQSDMQEREQRLQQVEVLNSSIRQELLSSETERRHLHEVISHKEREIQQYMQGLEAYETQMPALIQGMSRLEEELRIVQEEKAALLADLASVRELCVKLDSDKEVTARQLLYKNMEVERATTRQDDALTEAALLKEHLASEKMTIQNLEIVLATTRKEMFQAHQTAREKESELKALRDRLTQADKKIGEHVREISNLRGQVSQLQTKMEAQLQREHASEEIPSQELSFRPPRTSSPVNPMTTPHLRPPNVSSIN
ncbi:centrosomal protein of 135 kDa-like isoform X2 [Dunckerocampus dactyliophorus]|uniref:centrosomal protein of 135 kDa-like isoform X2 n=1 Tax=Dunckerocampus dactyliophorus TaxID=161453 RepID=UPI002404A040|nr:centrosomal protein of 135 kDa-like isoform X2 [Dunckerocampus dactyliophorus]